MEAYHGFLLTAASEGHVRTRRAGYSGQIMSFFLVFNFTDLALQSDTSGPGSFINGLKDGKHTSRSFVASEEHDGGSFARPCDEAS